MTNHSEIQSTDCGRIGIYYLKSIWKYYQQLRNNHSEVTKIEWKYINGVFNALGIGTEFYHMEVAQTHRIRQELFNIKTINQSTWSTRPNGSKLISKQAVVSQFLEIMAENQKSKPAITFQI
ncbi:MAG: hypothetical protein MK211_12090 [Flavobacteriales bacterium]|jgi:hypothetical protein|uniref:hypothetical protein n=1 Tax=Candidatus Ulvibacter alkanivorans TaxID=2267620 RepID=UPI001443EC06|nr:hypothetical protein [Candidatus Ulvibacter alkanivorans]MCH2490880.1 hypothetical protein [Flavobacteriales bacterium]